MAILCCAAFSVVGSHDIGDVIDVFPDNHQFGTHESLDVWNAAGKDMAAFPKLFYLISCPDLTVTVAQQYLASEESTDVNGPVIVKFRKWGFNVIATERRIGTVRPTLQTAFKITRNHSEIVSLFALKT